MATLRAEYLFSDDIRNDIRMKGFAEIIGTLYFGIDADLDNLKIYDLDNVDEKILDAYAVHINLQGYEYASSVSQKRNLCLIGAELQRHGGTPWAIQTALETLGFTGVIIWEGVTVPAAKADGLYGSNGFVQANGSVNFEGNFFQVSANNMTGNEDKATDIIYHYKTASSYLLSVFNN